MGWANLSIGSEITKIENSAKKLDKGNPETSEALRAVVSSLKKIEEAINNVAYRVASL